MSPIVLGRDWVSKLFAFFIFLFVCNMATAVWYQRHEGDTGSPEYQVWKLGKEILALQDHLKQNSKDYSAKRSLLKKVANRRQHLKYLKKNDLDRYIVVSKKTGLKV